jgi:hypothetical protein
LNQIGQRQPMEENIKLVVSGEAPPHTNSVFQIFPLTDGNKAASIVKGDFVSSPIFFSTCDSHQPANLSHGGIWKASHEVLLRTRYTLTH